jgi:hypothetical protein
MNWQTPKIDWNASNAPVPPDMIRIENNIRILGLGGRMASTTLTAAASVDIGSTDDTFLVAGTTVIKYISTTGRVAGNKIYLIAKDGNNSYQSDQTSPPAGYAALQLFKIGTGVMIDVTVAEGAVMMFVYNGTKWLHTH